jgi:hypothetical protein
VHRKTKTGQSKKLHGDLSTLSVALVLNSSMLRRPPECDRLKHPPVLYTALHSATGIVEWEESKDERSRSHAALAFASDSSNRWLAVGGENNKGTFGKTRVLLYDMASPATGKPVSKAVCKVACPADVFTVAISPDGNWLAIGCEEESLNREDMQREHRITIGCHSQQQEQSESTTKKKKRLAEHDKTGVRATASGHDPRDATVRDY